MKLVFLDIDGVMNHRHYFVRSTQHMLQAFCPKAEQNLKHILTTSQAKIVVSSSWRGYDTAEEIAQWLFSHYGLEDFVIGVTPHLTDEIRGKEIQSYLESVPFPVESFVILDDDKDMGDLLPYLVRTDPVWGLTEENANQAIALLQSGE